MTPAPTSTGSNQGTAPAPGFSSVETAQRKSSGIGGAFGALLDAVSSAIQQATGLGGASPKDAQPAGAATGFAAVDATAKTPAADTATTPTILGNLGEVLAAIDKALAAGKKPDKADLDRLDQALTALAGILNAAPATANANEAAATNAGGTFTLDARSALHLLASRPGGLPPNLAALAGDKSADLSERAVPVDPKALLTGLSGKLGALAATLKQADPALADKLAALGRQLGGPTSDPAILKQLGFRPQTADAGNQLAAALTARKTGGAGTSQDFAPARLTLPAGSTLSGKPQTQADTTPAPTAQAQPAAADSASTNSGGKAGADKADAGDKAAIIAKSTAAAPAPASSAAQASPAAAQVAQQPAATMPATFKPVQAAYQALPYQLNFAPLAVSIAHQAIQGASRFQMRLDPPELGRVDVKLHVDATGALNAHLTVDRADTLDLMQRDRSQLQRALMQAGIDAGRTNLQFSLNQNPSSGQNGAGQQHQPFNFARPRPAAIEAADAPTAPITLYRATGGAGGINLFV